MFKIIYNLLYRLIVIIFVIFSLYSNVIFNSFNMFILFYSGWNIDYQFWDNFILL